MGKFQSQAHVKVDVEVAVIWYSESKQEQALLARTVLGQTEGKEAVSTVLACKDSIPRELVVVMFVINAVASGWKLVDSVPDKITSEGHLELGQLNLPCSLL